MRRFALKGLNRYRNLGLLFARGIPGVILLYHGWMRYDRGVSNAVGFFESQGIPAPDIMVWVVTIVEIVGGVFLILGFLTRVMAVGFIVHLVLIIAIVKESAGLIGSEGTGSELELALISALAAVATFGPGSLSLDRNVGIEGRV